MTAKVLAIADFLLARIAEDEAASICSHGRDCPNRDFSYSPGLTDCNQMNSDPRRWLAECEAKRRIVNRAAAAVPVLDYDAGWAFSETLRALAAIYVDHPDYREEWRP